MIADYKTEQDMCKRMDECVERLQRVEDVLDHSTFFNGDDLALVDTAYAPLLIRLDFMREKIDLLGWNNFPKLNKWKENLLSLESVQKSIIDDFKLHYTNKIKAQNGYLGSIL